MLFPFSAPSGRRDSSHRISRSRQGGQSPGCTRFVRLAIEELEARCLLDGNPAVVPSIPAGFWTAVSLLEAPRGNPQVVFMGDSITQQFGTGAGASVWNSQIAPLKAADYGVNGNTTGNVLWQIENGQLAGIRPTVVVLMIGVNNLAQGQTPLQTAEGVIADVQAIEMAQPQAHILLLGELPAGYSPVDPLRLATYETNQLISALGTMPNISYLDFGASYLLPNGYYNSALTLDNVHPSEQGYAVEASAILPTIQQLLSEGPIPEASAALAPLPASFADPFAYPFAYPSLAAAPPAATTNTPSTPPAASNSSSSAQTLTNMAVLITNVLQNIAAQQNAATAPLPASSSTNTTASSTSTQTTGLVNASPDQADLSTTPGQSLVYTDQDGNPLTP